MACVMVTGCGRGIGLALLEQALAAGHFVVGTVRTKADCDRLTGQFGDRIAVLLMDMLDPASINAAFDGFDRPIDILVNNAGILGPGDGALSVDIDVLHATFMTNAVAPLLVARAALPCLAKSQKATIVTISSQMSYMGQAKSDHIAYRTSKVAANKLMQGLATDLKPRKIPVLVVDPGWVRTDMGGAQAHQEPSDVARGILALAARSDPAMSGKFFLWSGEERAF